MVNYLEGYTPTLAKLQQVAAIHLTNLSKQNKYTSGFSSIQFLSIPWSNKTMSKQACIPVGCVPSACWPYPIVSRCLPRGCLCRGMSAPGKGCLPMGCICPGGSLPMGVSAQGNVCLGGSAQRGVSGQGYVCIPTCNGSDTPPWTESQIGVKPSPCPKLCLQA